MGYANRVCNSMNWCIPSGSILFGEVDNRNAMVGMGVVVSVEKRFILSVNSASLRLEVVRMRNGWVTGRCCGLVRDWMGRARSWVWRLLSELMVSWWVGESLMREKAKGDGTVEGGVDGRCEEGDEGGEGGAAAEGGAEHEGLGVYILGGCLLLRLQWNVEGAMEFWQVGCLEK